MQYSHSKVSTAPHPFRKQRRQQLNSMGVSECRQWFMDNTKKSWMHSDSRIKLSSQIKRTTANLRVRRFRKVSNDQNKKLFATTSQFEHSDRTDENACPTDSSRSFSQFMRKKKAENAYMVSKMKIFGNTLTERSKAKIECEINDLLAKNQPVHANETEAGSRVEKGVSKLQKYVVCHKILQNLFELMVKNPLKISLKTETPQLFMNLKREMVEVMIDSQAMNEVNNKIQEQLRKTKNQKFEFSRKKLQDMHKNRKPFYVRERKKDEMADQIDKHLQHLKIMMLSAIENIDRRGLSIQIKQKWQECAQARRLDEETRIQ